MNYMVKKLIYKMDRRFAYINFRVAFPAEIQRVLIDQDNKRIDIILTEENLSKAIGRRGQNVRLASNLQILK